MPVVGNRIKVASSSTGTGNITLGSAEDGYQTFAAGGISNNDVVRYVITEGSAWEIGKGTYLTSGPTLVRTSGNLLESSTGSLLNLSGSATVFVSLADVDVMQTDGGTFSGAVTFSADTNLNGITAGNQAIYRGNGALKLTGGGPQNSRNLVNLSNSAGATIYGGSASTNATLRSTYGVTIDGGDGDVDITGNMTVSGTVDGVDIATNIPSSLGAAGQVLTVNAGATAGEWADAAGAAYEYTIENKTAAYTVVAGDLGKIINCTSGTFTITLTAAATLGSGFSVYIWNTGTGAITIDPNASETIDGATTYILRQNEGTEVVCDGSNFSTGAKKTMRGYAENLPSTYGKPVASGAGAIALGNRNGDAVYLSQAQGARSFAVNGYATANYSAAIGQNSNGGGAEAGGAGAMALGGSYASGADSFAAAIATNSTNYGAQGANGVAIGLQAKTLGAQGLALGAYSQAAQTEAVALGGGYAQGVKSISIGSSSHATSTYGCAVGYDTTAVGSALALGTQANAQQGYSVAIHRGKSDQQGKIAFSGIFFGTIGDAQGGSFVLVADTTDATATVLTGNNGTASSTNQIVAASDTCITFDGTITAMQNGAQAYASWKVEGLLVNDGGTTTLANSATTVISNSSSWGMALSADNTNNALAITCTGEAAHNIRWVANIRTSEVTYA